MKYHEVVPAPLWLKLVTVVAILAFAVPIGTTAGLSTMGTGEATIFYLFMSLGLVTMLVVAINFLSLEIRITDDRVRFAYGWFSKELPVKELSLVGVEKYNWLTYGGWGLRVSTKGRRAWSMPGVAAGVAIRTSEKGKPRSYFVSSRSPAELAAAIKG